MTQEKPEDELARARLSLAFDVALDATFGLIRVLSLDIRSPITLRSAAGWTEVRYWRKKVRESRRS